MKLGNQKWEHTSFNSRLQPTLIGLGTSTSDSSILKLDYGYGTTANNGNVTSQTITAPSMSLVQSYGYDALNRLSTATETDVWSQSYGYDRWGNRWVASNSGIPLSAETPRLSTDYDTATNNKLVGCQYDVAGNMTYNAAANRHDYDAENRLVNFSSGAGQYYYDGDGKQVKKVDSSGTTVMVYNVSGQLIAEYHSDPVLAPAGGGTSYVTQDHLGSTRVVTDSSGMVKARYDYLPFGEEIGSNVGGRSAVAGYGGNDGVKQLFTSKERDNESGLDYFGARYYSSAQGRFTSTDPVIVTPERFYDPQQFNLYAYTRNNPLRFIDPTGMILTISGDIQEAQKQLASILGISDADKRITYDARTNTITVNLTGIDLSQNEGAALLNDLVTSKNHYDLSIGSTVETLGGVISLDPKDKKNKTGADMVNLDVNPDDRYNHRKPPGKVAREKPKPGIDDQVAFNLAGRAPRLSDTKLKPATIESIVFHEFAEAYAKIEHNKQYADAHQEAIQREQKLRNERPYLKNHNPGSGPGDRVIIKR